DMPARLCDRAEHPAKNQDRHQSHTQRQPRMPPLYFGGAHISHSHTLVRQQRRQLPDDCLGRHQQYKTSARSLHTLNRCLFTFHFPAKPPTILPWSVARPLFEASIEKETMNLFIGHVALLVKPVSVRPLLRTATGRAAVAAFVTGAGANHDGAAFMTRR